MDNQSYKLVAVNPPQFVDISIYKKVGIGKKYRKTPVRKYFTANIWYGTSSVGTNTGKNEILIRQAAKNKAIWFLKSYIKHIPKFTKFPIRISYEYHYKLGKYDLHNKLFFWAKIFEDYITKIKVIPDDSVKYITEESYKYIESKESKLVITIESI